MVLKIVAVLALLAVVLGTLGIGLLVKRRGKDRGTEVFAPGGGGGGSWLRVRRLEGDFRNRNRRVRIVVDGHDVAAVNQNDTARVPLTPGRHLVSARLDFLHSDDLAVDLEPGQTLDVTLTDPADRKAVWFPLLTPPYLQLQVDGPPRASDE